MDWNRILCYMAGALLLYAAFMMFRRYKAIAQSKYQALWIIAYILCIGFGIQFLFAGTG